MLLRAEMIHNKQLHCLSTLLYQTLVIFFPVQQSTIVIGKSHCPQSGSDTSPGLLEPSGHILYQLHFPKKYILFADVAQEKKSLLLHLLQQKPKSPQCTAEAKPQKTMGTPRRRKRKRRKMRTFRGRTLVPNLENKA